MKKSAPVPGRLRHWMDPSNNDWIWIAIGFSILLCLYLTWLLFRQQENLEDAAEHLDSMRLARIEMAKGFLFISLAGSPEVPFDRNQGIALLDQSVKTFQHGIQDLQIKDEQVLANFQTSLELFKATLQSSNGQQPLTPGELTDLRIAFFDLDRQASEIDLLSQQYLQVLGQRQKGQFLISLGIVSALLSAICAIVYINGRARQQALLALSASEQRFRSLAESSQDYIMLYDRQARHVYMNPAGLRVSGFQPEDILGKSHREAGFSAELSELWESDIEKVFATGAPSQRLFEWESIAGKIHLDWHLTPVIDNNGEVGLVLGVARDVTNIKDTEHALMLSETQYRVLTENIKDVVWVLDSDTLYFRYISPSVVRMRGYTPDEILSEPFFHPLSPEEAAALVAIIQQRVMDYRTGRVPPDTYYTDEVELPCRDGSTVLTEAVTTYYINPENGHIEIRGVSRDIGQRIAAEKAALTARDELQRQLELADQSRRVLLSIMEDQKRSEEQIRQLNAELEERVRQRTTQLEAANKELEAFSYSVSHDLRAPLRAMDGFSAALLDSYKDQLDDQARHYLNRIQEASRRMAQLINDLLNLSRITRAAISHQKVDLSGLARDITGELLAREPERQVQVTITPDLWVEGDAHLLKIALENLLNNAFKFTARQPAPEVAFGYVDRDGERVYYVKDNGAGFSMEYAGKLFAPFQRLHGATEYPGTGIGLVTVQRIITRHGGRIWPQASEDQGAVFYFTLGGSR